MSLKRKYLALFLAMSGFIAGYSKSYNAGNVNAENMLQTAYETEEETILNMGMVEQKPSFPGGDSEMYKWISNNLVYPSAAAEEGVSGKVSVQFVVEKDGSLTNVKVIRGKHSALDQEAVRVIRKMPKWIPGRNNGAPVRVIYMLPITFKL